MLQSKELGPTPASAPVWSPHTPAPDPAPPEVYLFQCTPVSEQILRLIPHMHGVGHERLQELLQRLLKCKLSACCLTSLEEEELRTRGMTLKILSSPLQKLIWEYIIVPGAIGPSSDLQAFDFELCDVVDVGD